MELDLLSALRSLRRHPAFTILAVLTLGLGIGATTTVLSVAEAVLLRPLPYPDSHELVAIFHGTVEDIHLAVARLEVPLLREQTDVFQEVGARSLGVTDFTYQTGEGPPAHARVLMVSYNYLSILGIEPFLGRTFVLEDALPTSEVEGEEEAEEEGGEEAAPQAPALILTYDFWQRAMGGDRDFFDRAFRIAGNPYQIIGVLPPHFRLLHEQGMRGTTVDMFVVWPEEYFTRPGARVRVLLPLARLRPGISPQQAEAATEVVSTRLRGEDPRYEREQLRFQAEPLREFLTAGSRPILFILTGGVLFLMLLVCANLATLMLVRGRIRRGEDAVKATVGCGRGRLFVEKCAECVLLIFFGGLLGIGFAAASIRLVHALAPPAVPLLDQVQMNGRVVLMGIGAALLLILLLASISAAQVGGLDLAGILKDDGPSTGRRSRRKLLNALVVGELALSMALLTGAGIMVRTLVEMTRADFGFRGEQVLAFDLMVYAEEFRTRETTAAVYAEMEERLEALPGVEAVARTRMAPLYGRISTSVYGWDPESWERGSERADVNICTEDYFEVMGARLLAGRFFTEAEMTDPSESIIVDAKLAGIAWPDEDPIGKRLDWRLGDGHGVVVGVVDHMLTMDFGSESIEAIHQPEGRFRPGSAGTFVVRSRIPPEMLTPSIQGVLRSIHPTLVPYNVWRLSDRVSLSIAPTRFVVFLMGSFAGIAILVAVTGLFCVISYAVRTRTAELGVRMALGADKRRILTMVLQEGAVLSMGGILVGVVGALILARFIENMVFGVSPTDPVVLVGTAVVLGVVSLLACWAPARWACRVDPVRALRTE